MEYIIATRERTELVELTKTVHRMGLSGEHGTWNEFLKFYDPRSADICFDPNSRPDPALIQFLTSINKKDDSRKLALLLNPSRPQVCDYSYKYPNETAEQRLVRKTLTHDEYPFDFLIPYNSKDWVLTGIIGSPLREPISRFAPIISYSFRSGKPFDISKTEMIAVCCEKVLCLDNTEAAVRVAAVDRNLKVILDVLVEPNQPVINYRTSITGLDSRVLHLSNATPLSDIQEKLLGLLPTGTIMVGHLLNKDLKALKMDHARVIDTSLLFKYDISPCIGKLPRPSLDHLCKSVLGYEIPKSRGRCVHEAIASMKLVLAILEHGARTSVPLPDEMLKTDESGLLPMKKNVLSKRPMRNNASPPWCKPSWKSAL
ncbi:hypothetical protein HID58_051413 [Brassica napus]|uniref:Exonuclease domain-containing protein n=2 Tax=Brassica napus TaxID=3708 RepID=A0ABQ8A955_BRANA|nr:small RNA degrading nuclease 2-like [Brassica napus]KAH0888984.1 hypothetical protein HID58_051413 [Brassica napus]